MKKFIISIDQGTTSSRAILFDLKGKPVFSSQKEFTQYFPNSGWVEHNPEEIWSTTKKVLKDVIIKANDILQDEISPISDVRGTSEYKRLLGRQLFFAHFTELFPEQFQLNDFVAHA